MDFGGRWFIGRRGWISMPFWGMVMAISAQVTNMVFLKMAMSEGTNNLVIIVYSNSIAFLILLPSSFLFHRSQHVPPLTFSILCKIFLLGLFGCVLEIAGLAGLKYTSPAVGSAMLNLTPAFTFILAVIFRVERVKWRSLSTLAKSTGTIVSIAGAFVMTLYHKGPIILNKSSSIYDGFESSNRFILSSEQHWIIGGFFLSIQALFISSCYILQSLILREYPAELNVVCPCCFFVAFFSAAVALAVERDLTVWKLQSTLGLLAILYSGVVGIAFRLGMTAWCLRRTSPVFVSMFKPLGIIVAAVLGLLFLGDVFYLGSLAGAVVIVTGFYAVMWGKAKEENMNGEEEEEEEEEDNHPTVENYSESSSQKQPLLHGMGDEIS